jgi:hypothetical protein
MAIADRREDRISNGRQVRAITTPAVAVVEAQAVVVFGHERGAAGYHWPSAAKASICSVIQRSMRAIHEATPWSPRPWAHSTRKRSHGRQRDRRVTRAGGVDHLTGRPHGGLADRDQRDLVIRLGHSTGVHVTPSSPSASAASTPRRPPGAAAEQYVHHVSG